MADDTDDMTEEELDAYVEERRKVLPKWWEMHEKRQREYDGPRLGRAATPVKREAK